MAPVLAQILGQVLAPRQWYATRFWRLAGALEAGLAALHGDDVGQRHL